MSIRRNPSRSGRDALFSITEEKAAHRIAEKLSKLFGTYVDPYDLTIYSAVGYWAHTHQDVQRFTGTFPRPDMPRLTFSFGSWDLTPSRIASGCRFEIADDRGDHKRYGDFQISSPAVRTAGKQHPA